jgi:hypothetical protein
MATETNKAIYFSLFASYRFGLVIDPYSPESNTVSGLFRKKRE